MNSPNVTFQNCTDICNDEDALIDPLLPNNLLTCGLWASLMIFEQSVEDPVPFMSLGLDHENLRYVDDVRRIIGDVFGVMSLIAKAGTSSITFTVPEPCTMERIFANSLSASRYAAPCFRLK